MREYSSAQIQDGREFCAKREFSTETAIVGGVSYSYFVMPQDLNPDFPDFMFRMTGFDEETNTRVGIFGVSESVPEELRQYWVGYEVRAFLQYASADLDRFFKAETATFATVPPELQSQYISRRVDFFRNAIQLFENQIASGDLSYTAQDVRDVSKALQIYTP